MNDCVCLTCGDTFPVTAIQTISYSEYSGASNQKCFVSPCCHAPYDCYESTDDQQLAFGNVRRWAKIYGKPIHFGSMCGKSQSMMLHFKLKSKDWAVRIYPDGKITVWGVVVCDYESFADVVRKHDAKEANDKIDETLELARMKGELVF